MLEQKEDEVLGLDDDLDSMLQLVSQEGKNFSLPRKIAVMSELVKTIAEGDKKESEIPLPNVKAEVLNKVVQ